MTAALDNFSRVLGYAEEDFQTADREWDEAARLVIDGAAAMTIMGDWAEAYFKSVNWEPDIDFGWAASPGSAGVFDALSDSFGLPKGAPNPEAVMAAYSAPLEH